MTIIPTNAELQNNNIDTWERLVLYSALMLRSSYLRDEGNQSNRAIAISLFTDNFPYSIKIQSSLDYSSLIFNDSGIGLVNPVQNISSEDARFRFNTYTPIVSRDNLSSDFLPFYNYPDFVDTLEKLFIYSLGGVKRFLEEEGDANQENFSINFFDLRTPLPQIITEAQLPFDFNCWVNDLHFFNCLLPIVPLNVSQTIFDYSEINLIFNYTNFDEQLQDYQIDTYSTSYELALNLSEVISDYSTLNLNFPYAVSDNIDESISELQITEQTVSEVGITETLTNEIKLSFTSNDYLTGLEQQLTISYETSESVTEQVDIESETTYQNVPDIDIIDTVQSINYPLSINISENAIDITQELSLTLFSQINDGTLGVENNIQLNINYQASINESVTDLEEFSINSNYDSTVGINDAEQTIEYNLTNFVLDLILDNSQLNYSQEYNVQESITEFSNQEYLLIYDYQETLTDIQSYVNFSQEFNYNEELAYTSPFNINLEYSESVDYLQEDASEIDYNYQLDVYDNIGEATRDLHINSQSLYFNPVNQDSKDSQLKSEIKVYEVINDETVEASVDKLSVLVSDNIKYETQILELSKNYFMAEEIHEINDVRLTLEDEVNDSVPSNYESTVKDYNPRILLNFEDNVETSFNTTYGGEVVNFVRNTVGSNQNDQYSVNASVESLSSPIPYTIISKNYSDPDIIGNIGNEYSGVLTVSNYTVLLKIQATSPNVYPDLDDVIGTINWSKEVWVQWAKNPNMVVGQKIDITNNNPNATGFFDARHYIELISNNPGTFRIHYDNLTYDGILDRKEHHIVLTSGLNGFRLFVDGVLRDSSSTPISYDESANTNNFYLHGRVIDGFSENHIFSIAYWILYDYELSSTQVQTLYDRGKL